MTDGAFLDPGPDVILVGPEVGPQYSPMSCCILGQLFGFETKHRNLKIVFHFADLSGLC